MKKFYIFKFCYNCLAPMYPEVAMKCGNCNHVHTKELPPIKMQAKESDAIRIASILGLDLEEKVSYSVAENPSP